jgi:hypothetical protein
MFDVSTFLEEPYRWPIGFFYQCAKQFQTSFPDNIFTLVDQAHCDSTPSAIGVHGQTVDPSLSRIAAHNGSSDKAFLLKGSEKEIRIELHFCRNGFPAVSASRFVRKICDGPEVNYFVIVGCRQSSDLQS